MAGLTIRVVGGHDGAAVHVVVAVLTLVRTHGKRSRDGFGPARAHRVPDRRRARQATSKAQEQERGPQLTGPAAKLGAFRFLGGCSAPCRQSGSPKAITLPWEATQCAAGME